MIRPQVIYRSNDECRNCTHDDGCLSQIHQSKNDCITHLSDPNNDWITDLNDDFASHLYDTNDDCTSPGFAKTTWYLKGCTEFQYFQNQSGDKLPSYKSVVLPQ